MARSRMQQPKVQQPGTPAGFDRRTALAALVGGIAAGAWPATLALARDRTLREGASARGRAAEDPESRRMRRRAIDRGTAFIAQRQDPLVGSFGHDNEGIVAITALCVVSLMAHGSTEHRGPYRDQVRKGIGFLLGLVEGRKPERYPAGYFFYAHDQLSRMHGQGFATLALACALGTSEGERSRRIRRALTLAVDCIEGSQATTGGFGYEPRPDNDHEGSVTVCVAQGLRAARDAGVAVNESIVKHGLHYLEQSQREDGSFQYSLARETSTYALTAAALSSFFLYGQYEDGPQRRISRGLAWMEDSIRKGGASQDWYYYGHFYAAWALWQWDGDTWEVNPSHRFASWQAVVFPDLLHRQRVGDGSFEEDADDRHDRGPLLSTAFATLTLSIPDEGLPVFQR